MNKKEWHLAYLSVLPLAVHSQYIVNKMFSRRTKYSEIRGMCFYIFSIFLFRWHSLPRNRLHAMIDSTSNLVHFRLNAPDHRAACL